MRPDPYAGAAAGWATGAGLVYGPLVAELVRRCPHPLTGHVVLDAGAGTGVATGPLRSHGARPVAVDASPEMLRWHAAERPPAVVADLCALPLADASVDDVLAAFVLNHLPRPDRGLAELARVTRPGGAVLAAVFGTANASRARNVVDEVAAAAGWRAPSWYTEFKAAVVPLLGSGPAMAGAAARAGLTDVVVAEEPVDVGVDQPEQLVAYRLGQAPFARWLDQLGPSRAEQVRRRAVVAVGPVMHPYRPLVVFLTARFPPGGIRRDLRSLPPVPGVLPSGPPGGRDSREAEWARTAREPTSSVVPGADDATACRRPAVGGRAVPPAARTSPGW